MYVISISYTMINCNLSTKYYLWIFFHLNCDNFSHGMISALWLLIVKTRIIRVHHAICGWCDPIAAITHYVTTWSFFSTSCYVIHKFWAAFPFCFSAVFSNRILLDTVLDKRFQMTGYWLLTLYIAVSHAYLLIT